MVTDNINFLQPTGFRILIESTYRNFQYFAQAVSHPSITTNAAEAPFRQYTSAPMVPDTFQYGELSTQAVLDEDMNSYLEIFNWIKDNTIVGVNEDETERSTYADITLTILTSKNNLNKTIRYRNAFPTDLGNIQFESTTESSTPVITFPVNFRYTYFEIL
jgi:hypothetical protein